MTAPLVVVCVDGGDERIVDRLLAAGRLPYLADFLAHGSRVAMETLGDTLEECVWGPLLAGVPPGDHALTHFLEFDAATQGLRLRRESVLEPFWIHLGERGRGCLAFDVPESHPHPASRADEVCGWSEVSPSHRPLFTSAEVRAQVRLAGRPSNLAEPTAELTPESERRLVAGLIANQARRFSAIGPLLSGRPVACIGVHESHVAVHALGHHADIGFHWKAPELPQPALLEAPYVALDRSLAGVAANVRGANVAIVFARGIRPANHSGPLLEALLERAGLLVKSGDSSSSAGGPPARVPLIERVRRLVPERTRERVATALLPQGLQVRLAGAAFRDAYDWSRTAMFPLPTWGAGLLRVNLLGRERFGMVAPEERDELLAAVRLLLRETVNADTGRPLVAEVYESSAFPGRLAHLLPDLLVVWAGDRPARRASHPRLGTWEAAVWPKRWTEHRRRATVLLAGPGVAGEPRMLREKPRGWLRPCWRSAMSARRRQ